MAVNCGMAEFLLEVHLGMLLRVGDLEAKKVLTSSDDASQAGNQTGGLNAIPNAEVRALFIREACNLFGSVQGVRNDVLHESGP